VSEPKCYLADVHERGVRLVFKPEEMQDAHWAAIQTTAFEGRLVGLLEAGRDSTAHWTEFQGLVW